MMLPSIGAYPKCVMFQYAPWNYKRQAFDADRCGIEKGSVFLVKTKEKMPATSTIGFYQNEGFGHIVYNPVFWLLIAMGVLRFVLQSKG